VGSAIPEYLRLARERAAHRANACDALNDENDRNDQMPGPVVNVVSVVTPSFSAPPACHPLRWCVAPGCLRVLSDGERCPAHGEPPVTDGTACYGCAGALAGYTDRGWPVCERHLARARAVESVT
jgi:hypothetical protein